jgi:hypothetical protein
MSSGYFAHTKEACHLSSIDERFLDGSNEHWASESNCWIVIGHSDLATTMAYLKGSDAASERSQAQVARAYEAFV